MTADDLDKLLNDPKTWVVTEFNNRKKDMNLEPDALSPEVQELMDDFKGNLSNIRKACMNLYGKLTPLTGDNLWAVKVIDPLDEIDTLLTYLYKAKDFGYTRGSDGGIIISDLINNQQEKTDAH